MPSAAKKATKQDFLDRLHPDETALFLDFDGVIAEIVDNPDEVQVPPPVKQSLEAMSRMSGGAVAIVSGREINQIDRFLRPLHLPVAGIHGAQRRTAQGQLLEAEYDSGDMRSLREAVDAFVKGKDGLTAEVKASSVALHYRHRPEAKDDALSLADKLSAEIPNLSVVNGKMVIEMKLGGRTKGDAIRDFMDEPPFFGRTPIFFGDDVTDEDGFAAVNDADGISVKIGPGETAARHRMDDVTAFHAWLDTAVARWRDKLSEIAGRLP